MAYGLAPNNGLVTPASPNCFLERQSRIPTNVVGAYVSARVTDSFRATGLKQLDVTQGELAAGTSVLKRGDVPRAFLSF